MKKQVFFSSTRKGDKISIQRREGYIVPCKDEKGQIDICFEEMGKRSWRLIERSTGLLISEGMIGEIEQVVDRVEKMLLWNIRIILDAFELQPKLAEYKQQFAALVKKAITHEPPPDSGNRNKQAEIASQGEIGQEVVKKCVYGMRCRGFSIGCQPMNGFVERRNSPSSDFYDVLVYSRLLTEEERTDYELTFIGIEEHK